MFVLCVVEEFFELLGRWDVYINFVVIKVELCFLMFL